MKTGNVKHLVTAAVFSALICVATTVFAIPLPGSGFANLGDCFVIASGCLLGPVWGAAAGAVGASLADLLLGYGVYAPATFVIKGLMAAAAFFVFKATGSILKNRPAVPAAAAAVSAELVMVAGYFLFEFALLGIGVAVSDLPGNISQGAVGLAASVILLSVITGNRRLYSFFDTPRKQSPRP